MRAKFLQEIIDETPKDVEIFVRWYADLTLHISQILKEKGISQKELAASMGKLPSEVSKWMNSEHNFTLRSLAKLQVELGEELLFIPSKKTIEPSYHGAVKMTVLRSSNQSIRKPFTRHIFKQDKKTFANVG